MMPIFSRSRQGCVDRRSRKTHLPDKLVEGQERILLEKIVDTKCRSGTVAFGRDALAALFEEVDNPGRSLERLARRFDHPGENKIDPGFPISVLAHLLEQPRMHLADQAQGQRHYLNNTATS